jgi:hypothetical protein
MRSCFKCSDNNGGNPADKFSSVCAKAASSSRQLQWRSILSRKLLRMSLPFKQALELARAAMKHKHYKTTVDMYV